MAQSAKCLTSAQVMSSQLWVRATRQALCWELRAWSLLQILCVSLSLTLPHSCSVSLCLKKINKCKKKKKEKSKAFGRKEALFLVPQWTPVRFSSYRQHSSLGKVQISCLPYGIGIHNRYKKRDTKKDKSSHNRICTTQPCFLRVGQGLNIWLELDRAHYISQSIRWERAEGWIGDEGIESIGLSIPLN